MAELRYNPLIDDWVMIASHRQGRPQMPEGWCPFCVGGNIKQHYDVMKYDNDYPALSANPPDPDFEPDGIYGVAPSYGKCEVILYSPQHDAKLWELPESHIRKLVNLWEQRYVELSKDRKNKFIFIFENRGEVVGVTMPHPHGQIYAYPFIPKRIQLELDSCAKHMDKTGKCLICEMNDKEMQFSQRIIMQDEHFVVYIPFFSEYPYGVYMVPKKHRKDITDLTEDEKQSLAVMVKRMSATYDALFDKPFPYMMCMYQTPVNSGAHDYYHFHVVFYPPMRSSEKQKFNASSETGAWAHCNPTAPEQCAVHLREAVGRVKSC